MPGTTIYHQALSSGQIKSEVDHLNWLSIEQALVEDEFLNMTPLSEKFLRDSYKRLYDSYLPGPVMDFRHFPRHFEFFHPNADNGKQHSVEYAGNGWREKFSSAGPALQPGWEQFTLATTGVDSLIDKGTRLREHYANPNLLPTHV
jgi:hypothetical protein